MPDILSELGKYNVSPQDIQEGKKQVLNAEAADSQHRNAVAEAILACPLFCRRTFLGWGCQPLAAGGYSTALSLI